MAQPDKLLPSEPQAEKLVLGTIMTERNALNEVRDILSPECFYDKLNRAVYEAITAIDARGESPDLVPTRCGSNPTRWTSTPYRRLGLATRTTSTSTPPYCTTRRNAAASSR